LELVSRSNRLEDALLGHLVRLANEDSMAVGVTLTVKGVIISGLLIGYERYYDGIINNMRQTRGKKGVSETQSIDKFMERINQARNMTRSQKADEITFVHLEKAVLYNNLSKSMFSPNFWRVKLDSIDSFMIGTPEEQEM
jgi:hypothetical protein